MNTPNPPTSMETLFSTYDEKKFLSLAIEMVTDMHGMGKGSHFWDVQMMSQCCANNWVTAASALVEFYRKNNPKKYEDIIQQAAIHLWSVEMVDALVPKIKGTYQGLIGLHLASKPQNPEVFDHFVSVLSKGDHIDNMLWNAVEFEQPNNVRILMQRCDIQENAMEVALRIALEAENFEIIDLLYTLERGQRILADPHKMSGWDPDEAGGHYLKTRMQADLDKAALEASVSSSNVEAWSARGGGLAPKTPKI